MVSSGTGQSPAKPSQGVLYLLQRSGLMATMLSQSYVCFCLSTTTSECFSCNLRRISNRNRGTSMKITSAGFQFLLHSPHEQLWTLLLQYLHMAEVCIHARSWQVILTSSIFISHSGTTNGFGWSTQLFADVINHGAGSGLFHRKS